MQQLRDAVRGALALLHAEALVWVCREAAKTNAAINECSAELGGLGHVIDGYYAAIAATADAVGDNQWAATIVSMTVRITATAQRLSLNAFRAEPGASQERKDAVTASRRTFREYVVRMQAGASDVCRHALHQQ